MAGSYGHVSFKDGKWSLVENMGDAHETVEQLLWLVGYLAKVIMKLKHYQEPGMEDVHREIDKLLDDVYYPMVRGEKPADDVLEAVEKIMGNPRCRVRTKSLLS